MNLNPIGSFIPAELLKIAHKTIDTRSEITQWIEKTLVPKFNKVVDVANKAFTAAREASVVAHKALSEVGIVKEGLSLLKGEVSIVKEGLDLLKGEVSII